MILVVEDEPDIRDLIVLHLTREDFRCRAAANGAEALRGARAARPDLAGRAQGLRPPCRVDSRGTTVRFTLPIAGMR